MTSATRAGVGDSRTGSNSRNGSAQLMLGFIAWRPRRSIFWSPRLTIHGELERFRGWREHPFTVGCWAVPLPAPAWSYIDQLDNESRWHRGSMDGVP